MDRGTLADARSVWRRFAQPRDARCVAQHGPARLRLLVALTALVTVAGAAGMYALEDELPGDGGLAGYATALWWTAMVISTLGSEYWPKTAEGRVLCFLLALIITAEALSPAMHRRSSTHRAFQGGSARRVGSPRR